MPDMLEMSIAVSLSVYAPDTYVCVIFVARQMTGVLAVMMLVTRADIVAVAAGDHKTASLAATPTCAVDGLAPAAGRQLRLPTR